MGKAAQRLAKLSKPRLYDAVPRERLFVRLDALTRHPLVWISGPPGAGKTTLVASWLERRDIPFHWYQLDAMDADPATFFYYLVELARQDKRTRALRLPYLTPEYLPDLPGYARRFFRKLLGGFSGPAVLVLDNCQEAEDGVFAEVLLNAAEETPDGVSLVVISRTGPWPLLARLSANQRLKEMLPGDLKLTLQESTAVLRQSGIPDDSIVRTLHERANGWAAGLILLASHLKRTGDEQASPAAASGELIFEYFAGETLGRASPADRTLLMATALLPHVSPAEAVSLTGNANAPKTLDRLHRLNYFIDRRMEPALSYRYHDLFREFLLASLHRETDCDIGELKLRAGRLAAARGDVATAVSLFRQGGHFEEAARCVIAEAPALIMQGRWKILQEWIRGLPEPLHDEIPWLRFWLGMARMQSDLPASRAILERCDARFRAVGDALGQAMCAAAIINACYYEYNDFSPMDPCIAELDRLVDEGLAFPTPAMELCVYSALVLAVTFRMPRHRGLPSYVVRAARLAEMDVDVNQRVSAAIGLITYYTFACDFVQGDALAAIIVPLLKRPELTALNQAFWWLVLGYYHEQPANRYARGREYYALADKVAAENGLRQTEFLSRVFRAYSHLCWGDAAAARTIVGQAIPLLSSSRAMDAAQLHLALALAAVAHGETALAARYAQTGIDAVTKVGAPFFSIAWKAVMPIALIMNGEYRLAEKWLDEAWDESEGSFMESIRPFILLVRAYLAHVTGRREDSLALLRQAIASGKVRGITYFYWGLKLNSVMLAEAIAAEIEVEYLGTIMRFLRVQAPVRRLEAWPWPVKLYTLGSFRLLLDGQPVEFTRKSPKKLLALLKVLVAMGGNGVPEQKLCDALWPGEEGDSAVESLRVNLHRLRKLLGHDEAIRVRGGQLSLDSDLCWTDVSALEAILDSADTSENAARVVFSLYRGAFLGDDADEPWALSSRERLRAGFIRFVAAHGRELEAAGRHEDAIAAYQRGIEVDNLVEELYRSVMRCYERLGRNAEGMAAYRRLRQTLSVVLGIQPSEESERLFRQLQQTRSA